MLQESLIYKFIYALLTGLDRSWNESAVVRFFRKCGAALKPYLAASGILAFISRDGYITRKSEGSLFFRAAGGLIDLPQRLLHPLYVKAEAAFGESLLFRIFLMFIDRLHILTAFFLFIALSIPHSYWNNVYSTAAVVFFLVLYFIRTIVEGNTNFSTKLLNVYLLIFILCTILAEVFSMMPKLSLRFLAFYLTCFMLVLLIASAIRSMEELMSFISIVLLGVTVAGLYGIYQYMRGIPVNVSQIDVSINSGNLSRVYSTVDNPNNFAEILVMLLPFYLTVVFNTKSVLKKLAYLALAVPPFVSLLLTLSRSGWIGFAVAVVVFLFFMEKRFIPVLLLLGILALPFLPQTLYSRIMSITNPADTSVSTRFDEYKTVFPLLKDYWFTGLGLGNDVMTSMIANYYIFVKGGKILQHSHNLYLQVWIETGIYGILSFLAFLGATAKRCIRAIYTSKDKYIRNILVTCVSSMAGILSIGLVEYVWFYQRVMLIFWVLIGIILAALNILLKDEASAGTRIQG